MVFQQPIKADIDRTLSNLMHNARHRLMIEKNRITAEAAQAGALHGNRIIVTVADLANQIHDASVKQATPVLIDFIERMQLPPAEVTAWARPHLENLGSSLLGLIPPKNSPRDHKRIVDQYTAAFQQRLDGALRDIETGFDRSSGFAGMPEKEEWVTAAEALRLLQPVFKSEHAAKMTICQRAHAGLIRARAHRLIIDKNSRDNTDVPKEFWWAGAHKALEQDWTVGDFGTWIGLDKLTGNSHLGAAKVQVQAFGVTFARTDIDKILPPPQALTPAAKAPTPPAKGGRPPADWWEDLLIDICFQHFRGDLKPTKQADIENAMQQWITAHGYEAATSTVRLRARKVWQAIQRDAEN